MTEHYMDLSFSCLLYYALASTIARLKLLAEVQKPCISVWIIFMIARLR